MTRSRALLALLIATLLVACGKYGAPRRSRPPATASSAALLEPGAESAEPTASPAVELESGAESPGPDQDPEKNP